jgi:hypothetical protein
MKATMFLGAALLALAGQAISQVPPPPAPGIPATPAPAPKATPAPVIVQPPTAAAKITPRLEPVAETKLVMVGLASANYKGLERILRDPPKDDQAWIFARGQALLIAETANLLMMRPPRNQGEYTWFERATELRSKASQLAKTLNLKDFNASRAEFVDLANTCNRCHQSFRIPVQIEPFAEAANQP